MSFNYSIVNHISNQDFASSNRDLLTKCQEIDDKYKSGNLVDCCKAARALSELILRYMYDRIIGIQNPDKPPMAGMILRDTNFMEKLDDVELQMAAEEVQKIGNEYSHDKPKPNESEEQFEYRMSQNKKRLEINTEKILDNLSIVLDQSINIINNRFTSVRGKLEIKFEQGINPRNGQEEYVLKAYLSDVRDRKAYVYNWSFQDEKGKTSLYRQKTFLISLDKKWMIGRIAILEAVNNSLNHTLSAQYGPIKSDEVLLHAGKETLSTGKGDQKQPNDNQTQTESAPKGYITVNKDENYNGTGVRLNVTLNDADFTLKDAEVSVSWGFIGVDGNYVAITRTDGPKQLSFTCSLNKNPFGKIYRCVVTHQGYTKPLEADFRELTEEDFRIRGDIVLKADIERQDFERRFILAKVSKSNFQGKADFTWYENGEKIEGANSDRIEITEHDIGNSFECEISKEGLTFTKRCEPYVLTESTYNHLVKNSSTSSFSLTVGMHDRRKVIFALVDGDQKKEEYTYQWTIIGETSRRVSNYKGTHLSLSEASVGESIHCEAVKNDTSLTLSACYGPLKDEDFDICILPTFVDPLNEFDPSTRGESASCERETSVESEEMLTGEGHVIEEILPAVGDTPTSEFATENEEGDIEAEVVTFGQNEEEKSVKIEDQTDEKEIEPTEKVREKRIIAPYQISDIEMPNVFDASAGLVHYLVCPNDNFALNDLEIVDRNTFIYRLLKSRGYERVLFVEVERGQYAIYSFDRESEKAFLQESLAEKPQAKKNTLNITSLVSAQVHSAKDSVQEPREPKFGWRRFRTFSTEKEFVHLFAEGISEAMSNTNHKTSIVITMNALVQYGNFEITNTIAALQRNNNGNILVVSMVTSAELWECFNQNQVNIHPWTIEVRNKNENSTQYQMTERSIEMLESKERIVCANQCGVDEIANLLLHKILVERDVLLSQIPLSKIYPLADVLHAHWIRGDAKFKSLPIRDPAEPVRQLETILSGKRGVKIVRELVETANELPQVSVAFSRNLPQLFLERICHVSVKRYSDGSTAESVLNKFDQYIGSEMQNIKNEIFNAVNTFEYYRDIAEERKKNGDLSIETPYLNMQFIGPPGTGKTSIAELTAQYLYAKGILPSDKVEIVNAGDLKAKYAGETGENFRIYAERTNGGVLVLDELQGLKEAYEGGNLAENAMRAIVSATNKYKDTLCIILAGYDEEVEEILKYDRGADRRFPHVIHFSNYSVDSLMTIFHKKLKLRGEQVTPEAEELIKKVILAEMAIKGKNFGNVGYVQNLIFNLTNQYLARRGTDRIFIADDVITAYPDMKEALLQNDANVDAVLAEFDQFVGDEMQRVKDQIIAAVDGFAFQKERNRRIVEANGKPLELHMNMQFIGPSGAGKTSIAKIAAKYMRAKGILPRADTKVLNVTEIVSGRVSETQQRILEEAENVNGGVLILDELQGGEIAYQGGNTAKDVMNGLVAAENNFRDTLCMILAGYDEDVQRIMRYDQGARSRFPIVIRFENYSVESLLDIFDKKIQSLYMKAGDGVRERLAEILAEARTQRGFGNGRYVDQLIGTLDIQYVARKGNDYTYILDDVNKAFPKSEADAEKKHNQILAPWDYEIKEQKEPFVLKSTAVEELIEKARIAVVHVEAEVKGGISYGTAFLISYSGYAVTCNHVIQDSNSIKVVMTIPGRVGGEESIYTCEIVKQDPRSDLALIKLVNGSNFPYLRLANENDKLAIGHEILVLGYPFKVKKIHYFGGRIASEPMTNESGIYRVDLNAEGKQGNSGSPVLSASDGSVVGIFTGSQTNKSGDMTEEINFMRPVDYVWKDFLQKATTTETEHERSST